LTRILGGPCAKIAADWDISHTLFNKIVKEDICYKVYSLRRGQFMSEATKEKRFQKASLLLNRLKRPPVPEVWPLAHLT
jgi:hypothetical protein